MEEIRNDVRLAIQKLCEGIKAQEVRHKGIWSRTDGTYTMNTHEDDTNYLGEVFYKIENYKITRIVIGKGFDRAPEIIAAFEGYHL